MKDSNVSRTRSFSPGRDEQDELKKPTTVCPYCDSPRGYHRIQQVKRLRIYAWDGTFLEDQDENVFYEGQTLRCISCDIKVTSFVKGLKQSL